MSITVDVFIRFKGSKKELLKILADDFLICAGKKQYWFLNFIEFGLNTRDEEHDYFVGHKFRPYNFVLGGNTYAWEDDPAEKPLSPPVSLLKWLASKLDEPRDPQIWKGISKIAKEKRKLLIARDPATIQEAIEAIVSHPRSRAWYVLEGESYPDVYLETRNLIVVIEGKRMEGRTTRVTSWLEGRHQMWRHIDCAWERRESKHVYGLMIVESPDQAKNFANETLSDEAITNSLPHRSPGEVAAITRCFLGATTWRAMCDHSGIPWESIANITA